MRSLWVIGAGAVMAAAGAGDVATAQQRVVTRGPGATYGRPTPHVGPQMQRRTVVIRRGPGAGRWGSQVGGRWWGGANAPGGWNAYRRQTRGYVLPSYWVAPRFYVTDWQAYGLTQPTGGYRWVRYYDDAVLVDKRGSVFDTVENVDWDGRYSPGGVADDGQVYADYDDAERDDRGRGSDRRGSDGLGGAAVGAVAGGVAGNVIAGRGNRLGGTLIGAGVGAAAGYAIDRSADRRRRDDRDYDVPVAPDRGPPPGAGYANPGDGGGYHHDGHPRPPHGPMSGGPAWTSPDGRTTVVTSGDYAGGYGGGSVTTVTVHSAPIVTTTTTETWEDDVTYTRRPARRMVKRTWPKAKTKCMCR